MRHAEVRYVGERDIEAVRLTERGLEQAAAAQRALSEVRFDVVLTSGLPRAVETAEVVAPDATHERWPDFQEWRAGRLSEIPPEELEQAFVGGLKVADEESRFLGGESLREALDRVHGAIDRLVARDWSTALAILHGAVNRMILSYALTDGARTYYGTFEQAPACINVLDLGETEWIVRTVNYIPYEPLHPARTTTMEEYWTDLKGWLDE
jgi:probable phosphoglycerate mutase